MSNAEVDIHVYPGKELSALDFAEMIDAATINSGILQGCSVSLSSGVLSITSGRILIKGRLGVVTGGEIAVPTLTGSSSVTCTLAAVCDLTANTPFYIKLHTPAELSGLADQAAATTDNEFNIGSGTRYVTIGTAAVNPSTGLVTSWTAATGASIKKDATTYATMKSDYTTRINTLSSNMTSADNTIKQKYNAWVDYLALRTSSSQRFALPPATSPAWVLTSGQVRGLSMPAVWGSTVTATAADSRTESIPSDPGFTRTYTIIDGTNIPNNIDSDHARFIPIAVTGIWLTTNTTYGGAEDCHRMCFIQGWNITTINGVRRLIVYVKNVGSARAVIDLNATILYVRRD